MILKKAVVVFKFIFLISITIVSLTLLCATFTFDVPFENIVFHARIQQLKYFGEIDNIIIFKYLLFISIPLFMIIYLSKKIVKKFFISYIAFCMCFVCFLLLKLGFYEYICHSHDFSNFIEKNYINPKNVKIKFNDKRNLIYIIVESLETTYTDKTHGGYFVDNLIPKLTEVAIKNVNFSENNILNGAYSMPGTTWTMGAIFAQSSGLPLLLPIGMNTMSTQQFFAKNIISLGDILKNNGYSQSFLLGSNSTFAGKNIYFKNHGDYGIIDYPQLKKMGYISSEYKEFWGCGDEKLLEIAKKELDILSKTQPFNLTILTVNTHFPDGFLEKECCKKYDNQYKNVIYCTDSMIYNFIEYIKTQDYYKNTTIVIVGDHPTMKKGFCSDSSERKIYTCIINSKLLKQKNRKYSIFDLFPTTLAALGASIYGNKLGLGVNLFSDVDTLCEIYGNEYLESELRKRSVFLDSIMDIQYNDNLIKHENECKNVHINNIKDDKVDIYFFSDGETEEVNVEVIGNGQFKKYKLERRDDVMFSGRIYVDYDKLYNVSIKAKKKDKYDYTSRDEENLYGAIQLKTINFDDFLKYINNKDYIIFATFKNGFVDNLSENQKEKFKNIGINKVLNDKTGYYCCLVINGDNITEIIDKRLAKIVGSTDCIKYTLESSIVEYGDKNSIVINGEEYSRNSSGMNFVVYSKKFKKVICSTSFDTSNINNCN